MVEFFSNVNKAITRIKQIGKKGKGKEDGRYKEFVRL